MDQILGTIRNLLGTTIPGGGLSAGTLLLALTIVAAGVYLSHLITRAVAKRLERAAMHGDAARLIARILFYTLLVGVAVTVLGVLGIPLTAVLGFLDLKISGGVSVGKIMLALVIASLGLYLARVITNTVTARLQRAALQRDAAQAIERILFYTLIAIVAVTVLGLLGIPLTAFAFVSGAAAIGVGFGAQNILNNFISGWILMSERPVRIGDVIEISGSFGVVEQIGARSTRIRRVDGVHMLVPNSTMLETTLVNWTLIDRNIRTSITVGVAYGSPVEKVREILLEAAHAQKEVLRDPPVQIVFDDFGDSALIFMIYFWTNVGSEKEMRLIRSEIRFRITAKFAEHGITIPFPQRDVHMISPAGAGPGDGGA